MEMVAFIFGCALVLIGIIGGGMEIKELKVPTISGLTRIISIVVGVGFIGFGVELLHSNPQQTALQGAQVQRALNPPAPVAPDPPKQVEFKVVNELAPTQVSEDLRIFVQGQWVADLVIDQKRPTATATITLPHAGSYSYALFAEGIFLDQFGQPQRQQGRGDGVIEVSNESVFAEEITPHGIRLLAR
jgi:hypothetical protein